MTTTRTRVVLLGATGSIGENTLRVIAAHPDKLALSAIAAHSNWEKLAAIAHRFNVPHVALFDDTALSAARASNAFPAGTVFHGGLSGLNNLARLPEADTVLVAVVGTTGLQPALAALAAGKNLALASKEILVLAGKFIMAAARASGARLLPVDSEHNAVFQCLEGHSSADVARITLTATAPTVAYVRQTAVLSAPEPAAGAAAPTDASSRGILILQRLLDPNVDPSDAPRRPADRAVGDSGDEEGEDEVRWRVVAGGAGEREAGLGGLR